MRSLLLALCLCQTAFADLSVEVKRVYSVQTVVPSITTQLQLEDGTLIGSPVTVEGDPETRERAPGAALLLKSDRDLTDSENVLVKVRCNTASFSRLASNLLYTDKPGRHLVMVMVLAQNPLAWDEQVVTVEIGPPPPPPPPPVPPPPPIPNDEFDNIGQRVFVWSAGVPDADRESAGLIYAKYATFILQTPSATIESASAMLVAELDRMPNSAQHKVYRENIGTDVQQRYPWTIKKAADYWRAVAAGLGFTAEIRSVLQVCDPVHGPCEVQIRN